MTLKIKKWMEMKPLSQLYIYTNTEEALGTIHILCQQVFYHLNVYLYYFGHFLPHHINTNIFTTYCRMTLRNQRDQ